MVQKVDVPLHEAIRMATENPARSLGLKGKKGCLAPSADADFAVLSSKLEVVRTFFRGRQIFPQSGSGGL
ncbi:MAG: amidohydrolase family protein [Verrucomicrobiota bacterium]|nr:amidohydrolase family protein [Verrucomicrobiota bacterium]